MSTTISANSARNRTTKTEDILIGALLRVPAHAIHRRLIEELNAAGFDDIALPHIAVFQFPGRDGVRPGTLAERAGMSKQAMNQLLRSLEGLGYIARCSAPDEGRARIVRFTSRGHAAYAKIYEILLKIELEWRAELGAGCFDEFKRILSRIWDSPLVR
jgi:DNA-binding MarR family transcriptional regulator